MSDFFSGTLINSGLLTQDDSGDAQRALRVDGHRDRIDSEKAAGADRIDPVVRRKMISLTWDVVDRTYRLPSDLSAVLGGWLYSLDDQDVHDWWDMVVQGYRPASANKQDLLNQLRAYKNLGL